MTVKVAIITGSAKRLGRALALDLAAQKYFCWIHFQHSSDSAKKTLSDIQAFGGNGALIQGDQANEATVKRMLSQIKKKTPRVDLLINNVGVYKTGPLLKFPTTDFISMIHTNFLGPYYWIQHCAPMLNHHAGIINIGYSGITKLAAAHTSTAYTISKTALHQLTLAYSVALAPKKIRVNTVSPGQLENSVDLPQNLKKAIPLGRAGKLGDITELVRFLISEKASYITGQNIEVAGGYMSSLQPSFERKT